MGIRMGPKLRISLVLLATFATITGCGPSGPKKAPPRATGWGYIDHKGNVSIPFHFDNAKSFSDGLAAVWIDHLWGYIDKTGKVVIPAHFQTVEPFSHGYAAVANNGKWGFIDKTGKIVVDTAY